MENRKRCKQYYERRKKKKLEQLCEKYNECTKEKAEDDDFQTYSFESYSISDSEKEVSEKFVFNESAENKENEKLSNSMKNVQGDRSVEWCNYDQTESVKEVSDLRVWAVKNRVPHVCVNELLKILKPKVLPSVPKCTKSLLTSNIKFDIECMKVSNDTFGEFFYFGIKSKLLLIVNPDLHTLDILELIFNIDGFSPFKSSSLTVWPTLCKVFTEDDLYEPFSVCVYAGSGKPKDPNKYSMKFVKELNMLQSSGIDIKNRHFTVRIKFFTCDSPARSYLKCHVSHVALKACERCNGTGKKIDHVTCFLESNAANKTDEEFRTFADPDYHTGVSLFCEIYPPIDIVRQFVLDPMHLLYLGCTKRLLEHLLPASSTNSVRLSAVLKQELQRRTKEIFKDIPDEFPRKMRPITDYTKYKAVEFKFFALYCAPIVLKKLLAENLYEHFLLFTVSCRLLSEKNPSNQIAYAQRYLKTFVDSASSLYGSTFLSLNVHNLIHVSDDVSMTGCNLNQLSAFSFESYLGTISNVLRSPTHIVAQYCRRMHEKENYLSKKASIPPELEIIDRRKEKISKIKYKKMILSDTHPNNTILLSNGNIGEIHGFCSTDNRLQIEIKYYCRKYSVFQHPCDSSTLDIWEISKISSTAVMSSLDSIKKKFVKFTIKFSAQEEKRCFVVPLLH